MGYEKLKAKFIEWFNVNHLMIELMDYFEDKRQEDDLYRFMCEQIRDEFTISELTMELQKDATLSIMEAERFIEEVFE